MLFLFSSILSEKASGSLLIKAKTQSLIICNIALSAETLHSVQKDIIRSPTNISLMQDRELSFAM